MQEANRIIDTEQKSLFNLSDYQIAPVPVREPVGDWEFELDSVDLLPNPPVREQPDLTLLPNLQIVTVKSQKYFLTPTKSLKELPENKGWFDIKKQKGNLYLYLRWREGETQKSGCLGRLDKITTQLTSS